MNILCGNVANIENKIEFQRRKMAGGEKNLKTINDYGGSNL